MSKTVSANLFQNLLELVSSNFTISSENNFSQLKDGVNQFTQFIFLQDALIDEDVNWVEQYDKKDNVLVDINKSYRNAIRYLQKVFSDDHFFWNYLFKEEENYYNYIIKEKYLSSKKSKISLADFEEMAFAKHALALVPIKGMEWLFNCKNSYEEIKNIFIPIFNGIQMMDDIDDFHKDYESGDWNFIQSEVQNIIVEEELIDDGTLTRFAERVFYASGICKEQSVYVLNEYIKAKKFAKEYQFHEIENWLDLMLIEIQESIAFVDKVNE